MWQPNFKFLDNCSTCLYHFDCSMQKWFKGTIEEDPNGYPNSNPCKAYRTNIYYTTYTENMKSWKKESFSKIVAGCNSEQELFDLQKQANEKDIINAIILDNGATEFKEICSCCKGDTIFMDGDAINEYCNICNGTGKINKPTYTCLAIGPDESEKIDKITRHLKLL